MIGLRLRPAFVGDIHKVRQVAWSGALVIRFLGDYGHKIAHIVFVRFPILDGNLTEGEAGVRAIDRVHDPAPDLRRREVGTGRGRKGGRNRTARDTRAQWRGQELAAIDYLHYAVGASAIREIDAVTYDPCRYGTMYGGYRGEVRR